jgi:hypothetical protein
LLTVSKRNNGEKRKLNKNGYSMGKEKTEERQQELRLEL